MLFVGQHRGPLACKKAAAHIPTIILKDQAVAHEPRSQKGQLTPANVKGGK